MKNPKDDLIWSGRIHIGDEPGVYGDAAYSGVCAEFPVTLKRFPQAEGTAEPADDIEIILDAADVAIFPGYELGHTVKVTGYKETAPGSNKWEVQCLGCWRLTGDELSFRLEGIGAKRLISIQVRVDTEVAPGLYNDFLLLRLTLRSTTHYAYLGYHESST
jgi:hypothetical protein